MLDWILLIPALIVAVYAYFVLTLVNGIELLIALAIGYPFTAGTLVACGVLISYANRRNSRRRKS